MSYRLRPLLWTIAAVALSAVTAFLVARATMTGQFRSPEAATVSAGGTFHDWLHSQLQITPDQEVSLAPIELTFVRQRMEILQQIQEAGKNLAAALESEPADSAAITEALAAIHDEQGHLQRITIEHFLKMKEHLSPDQSQRLLQWTRESITHHDGH